MVIVLSLLPLTRRGLAAGEEGEPMEESLVDGLSFGEWFISTLKEYILDRELDFEDQWLS